MSQFEKVHIKSLARPKLLKLMRGGAVRVSRPESAMEAMELFILPQHTKSIMGKFGKGQAHTLKMTANEIHRNSMEGGSLFETAKKYGKRALKYSAPVLKQAARAGIAAGSAALAAGSVVAIQPELLPFIPVGAAALGAMSDKTFDNLANMELEDDADFSPEMQAYGNMARDYATNYATDYIQQHPSYQENLEQVSSFQPVLQQSRAPSYVKYAQQNPYSQLGNSGVRELAQYGNLGANIQQTQNQARAAVQRQSVPSRAKSQQLKQTQAGRQSVNRKSAGRQRGRGMFAGGGLYAGRGLYAGDMRGRGVEKATVRVGGNLITPFGGMHPAILSQPSAVNFASRNFMSPAMAAMVQ